MDRKEILIQAIETYGIDNQFMMTVEEMAELTKAICKCHRAETVEEIKEAGVHLREEMADVKIMLEQLTMICGETGEIEEQKLERLRQRMEDRPQ